MDVAGRVRAGWGRHAAEPEAVFDEACAAVTGCPPDAAADLGALVLHVGGEHLARWADTLAALDALWAISPAKPLARARAVVGLVTGDAALHAAALADAAEDDPRVADGMVRAVAAAALVGNGRLDAGRARFAEALALGEAVGAPLARSLAVTGNNLALALEQRPDRSEAESDAMLDAATAGRRWWAVAGGWREVERAEYRLAKTRLARGEPAAALAHADEVLRVVADNGQEPLEALFGHEVRALALAALGRDNADDLAAIEAHLAQVDPDTRAWCEDGLRPLRG